MVLPRLSLAEQDFLEQVEREVEVLLERGKEAAVAIPTETFMGAEVWSWHQPLAIQEFQGKTKRPIRVAYFCDGHSAVTSEETIQQQCAPPAAPGIGPVP